MTKLSQTKKNVLLQTAYQIAAIIIPFITAPYISRTLGSSNVGVYSYSYSVVNYFMIFSMLGIDIYGVREIAKVKDESEKVNQKFSEIYFSHVIVSVLVLLIYIIFAVCHNGMYRTIFLVQTIYIIGELLNINWAFNGLSLFRITVVRNFIVKTVTIIAIFIFVKDSSDTFKYIMIMASGTCISTSAVWIVRKKYFQFTSIDKKKALLHIKPLLILFVSIVAGSINRMLDKTMLGWFDFYSELGCYEYADKFVRMPVTVITAVGTVMLSKTSTMTKGSQKNEKSRFFGLTLRYVSVFASLFVFGFLTFGKDFSVLYFGKEFRLTGSLLMILSVSLFFIAWSTTFKTQYFLPHGMDKLFALLTSLSALSNVIMNIILIPRFGAFGAAFATDISYLLLLFSEIFIAGKNIPKKIFFQNTIVPMLLGLPSFLIFLFAFKEPLKTWYELIFAILIFGFIYLIFFVIYMAATHTIKFRKITKSN